ncbi:hypothetical protein HYX10_01970 [Candidatus Woesearchaeota archaeon]|nr:hypothetical protein [Candidatus Woesearchaeota archaeon]
MEQSLRTVQVSLLKVVVKTYTPMENLAVFEIFYNSGRSKQITRTTKLGEANVLADQLVDDLLITEKNSRAEFDGETLTGVDVILESEQKTKLMLVDFFRTLQSKALQIKHNKTSAGYLDMIKAVQRMEITLYD